MHISFTKILLILLIAIAAALLVNYLQPEGLPLFKNDADLRIDEQLSNTPLKEKADSVPESLVTDYNKAAVEKNRVQINEDILPQYQYKTDTDLAEMDKNTLPPEKSGIEDKYSNSSNLTRDVFNQPRLISLAQAYELYRDKILFVDARDPEEFEDGHISGALNLPLFRLNEFSDQMNALDKDKPLVTYCEGADCDMSIRLGNELFSKGFKRVFVFFGGWEEWREADYPMVTSSTNIQLN